MKDRQRKKIVINKWNLKKKERKVKKDFIINNDYLGIESENNGNTLPGSKKKKD